MLHSIIQRPKIVGSFYGSIRMIISLDMTGGEKDLLAAAYKYDVANLKLASCHALLSSLIE